MNKNSNNTSRCQDVKSYAKRYIQTGWNIVPVRYGTKQALVKWEEYQTRKQTLAYLETKEWNHNRVNISIVCGRVSGLVVIDCDSQESVQWYERHFPNYVNTYKVKTRRGIHYYYKITTKDKEEDEYFPDTTKYRFVNENVKVEIDLKSERSLIMAPPSVFMWTDETTGEQKSHQYVAITNMEDIMTVSAIQFFDDVVKKLNEYKKEHEIKMEEERRKREEEEEERKEGIDIETIEKHGISKYKINENGLIEFLKEIYEEGQRNSVVMYVSGFLRKAGYTIEEAEEFFKRFFQQVDDEEEKARFATIKHTYQEQKDISQIKGYSGLLELCNGNEELIQKLKRCFIRRNKWGDGDISVKNWIVYALKNDGKNVYWVEVGPAFRVVKRLVENDTVKYVIETQYTQAVATTEDIVKAVTNASGSLILRPSDWKQFANKTFQEKFYRFPTVLSMIQTGWQKKRLILGGKERKLFFFAHPAIRYDDIEFEMSSEHLLAKHTEPKIDPEYERFVMNALSDGKLLGLLYLFSFSSVLIELMKESAFTVILSGESGAGKTTLASLACSLFYPASEELMTANATHVGIELAMKSLKNLPILLDEGALRKVNLQDIVFMVSQGKGKLRGTKHLGINLSSFSSVMFYTSEASELSELTRGGAFRRLIYIPIKRNDDMISEIYSIEDLISMRKYWGLGLDFVKRIQHEYENQTDLWKQAIEFGESRAEKYQGFSWLKVVYATLHLLEKILEIRLTKDEGFWTLESMLEDVMNRSLERFHEESNTTQKFTKILSSFLTQNVSKFITFQAGVPEMPRGEVIGYRYGGEVGILTSVFEKFVDESGFNIDVVLSDLDKQKILKRGKEDGGRRRVQRRKIAGVRSTYYVFDLEKLGIHEGEDKGNQEGEEIEDQPVDF